jgi:hypothetical protein
MEYFLRDRCLKKFKINYGVDVGTLKIQRLFLREIFSWFLNNTHSQIFILNNLTFTVTCY